MIEFSDERVSGPITLPWYIMEIQLGQRVARLSTGAEADWGDINFESGGIKKGGFAVDGNSLRVSLINDDYSMTSDALRCVYHGGRVQAWSAPKRPDVLLAYLPYGYAEAGYEEATAESEPEKVFDGLISEITEIGEVIGLIATRQRLGGFPSARLSPPLVNHVASHGAKITFNNTIYVVEQRR